VEKGIKQKDWRNVAQGVINLSEMELMLGEMARALGDAEESVAYADLSGDLHMREESRCTFADTLHMRPRGRCRSTLPRSRGNKR